ncbi:L,D-transpeptidase family protein [Halothiobacillus sp. DCM-1]|uniref:L,D-transpeptidase family protein n=1 Tax=Halothiobacillus sp. DCM-1 TaxID=3112558 RepID=UPI003252AE35
MMFSFPSFSAEIPENVRQAQNKVELLLQKNSAAGAPFIIVDTRNQKLYLFEHRVVQSIYPISSSAVGVGNTVNSNRTPLGLHKIAEKFGDGEPIGMIFKARRPSGVLAHIEKQPIKGQGDDVTTRIMWLQGLEPGINEGPGVDSHARFIYIHGTPEEGLIGTPESHGCIRMNNEQVIQLYNQVAVGTLVDIIQ